MYSEDGTEPWKHNADVRDKNKNVARMFFVFSFFCSKVCVAACACVLVFLTEFGLVLFL